ncbi:rhamnan synthesis F family protein [Vibrio rumoiensis]|uniref:rhamnan synthesis F family protein n=1 Tax=Vibrio rumoiensis TaxID=76258 RepID=UPI003747EFE2
MKRVIFYLFYDEGGFVDDYVIYKLSQLKKFSENIIVISNSQLTSESKLKLESVSDTLMIRNNIGFDVWGYKEGLEFLGDEKYDYDEAIFLNYTFFGPIYPFEELFSWSESLNSDFWGISDHKEINPNPFTGTGTLPRHIQSHFIAVKKRLLHSAEFANYWSNMPMIHSYQDSILQHESKFTDYFYRKGYSFDVYCNSEDYTSDYPTFIEITETLKNRCPILKRRPFFHDPLWVDRNAIDLREALKIVNQETGYDSALIDKNLLRTVKPKDLATNVTLTKIFDTSSEELIDESVTIAVLAHVYYPDMMGEMLSYIENIPTEYDLYITTATSKSKNEILDYLSGVNHHAVNVDVRVMHENRGRDISALVIECRDVVLEKDYDLICRLHSKKSPQNDVNQSLHFKKQMYDNLVFNRAYTSKLINFMSSNDSIGFITPSMVHVGYPTLGHSWFSNRPKTMEVAKRLGISVPFDDFSPFAAYGTMFWFKPDAMKRLFEEKWAWSEFNAEPGHNDGSLSHVIERLMIYLVHDSGYISYNVMSSSMAELNYAKLEYKAQRLLSNFPDGDVHKQVHLLESGAGIAVDKNLPLFRKLIRVCKQDVIENHANWIPKLRKPYHIFVKLYLKLNGIFK